MAKQEIIDAIATLGLSVDSIFVPFSQSRNKSEKHTSLNWKISVKRNGNAFLETDYMAGIAHCPAYKNRRNPPNSYEGKLLIAKECEVGLECYYMGSTDFVSLRRNKPILPDPVDVIYSLIQDAAVLDFSSFEDWAASFGYDEDSRAAEKIYKTCLDIALKFRNAVGDEGIKLLQKACEDY